jgi:hypothetical protein
VGLEVEAGLEVGTRTFLYTLFQKCTNYRMVYTLMHVLAAAASLLRDLYTQTVYRFQDLYTDFKICIQISRCVYRFQDLYTLLYTILEVFAEAKKCIQMCIQILESEINKVRGNNSTEYSIILIQMMITTQYTT